MVSLQDDLREEKPIAQGTVPQLREPTPQFRPLIGENESLGTPRASPSHVPAPVGKSAQAIFLMRHGESKSNETAKDILDPPLTAFGKLQAASWQELVSAFGAQLVLISPLRRAVQTACYVFSHEAVPLLLCRHAREKGWKALENTIASTPETMRAMLRELPRGSEVQGIEDALQDPTGGASEAKSLVLLREVLQDRPERPLFVVCHNHVIKALTGQKARNADILECRWAAGGLSAIRRYRSPYSQPYSKEDCVCH